MWENQNELSSSQCEMHHRETTWETLNPRRRKQQSHYHADQSWFMSIPVSAEEAIVKRVSNGTVDGDDIEWIDKKWYAAFCICMQHCAVAPLCATHARPHRPAGDWNSLLMMLMQREWQAVRGSEAAPTMQLRKILASRMGCSYDMASQQITMLPRQEDQKKTSDIRIQNLGNHPISKVDFSTGPNMSPKW